MRYRRTYVLNKSLKFVSFHTALNVFGINNWYHFINVIRLCKFTYIMCHVGRFFSLDFYTRSCFFHDDVGWSCFFVLLFGDTWCVMFDWLFFFSISPKAWTFSSLLFFKINLFRKLHCYIHLNTFIFFKICIHL